MLAAQFIATAGDIYRLRSPDALAAAAGLAPILRQSGRASGMRRAFGGDKDLKRVLYMAAFLRRHGRQSALPRLLRSQAARGKAPPQALISLARRQTTVLWCRLKHRTVFDRSHRKAA